MIEIIAFVFGLIAQPSAVEALRLSAPSHLTVESARVHLASATVAGIVAGQDPALLLAIAYNESRYTIAVSKESGGRVSCGVMTPEPVARCRATTLVVSYLDGANHLREWFTAARGNQRMALTGYAGGWRLIRHCAPSWTNHRCYASAMFQARSRLISRPLEQPRVPRRPTA